MNKAKYIIAGIAAIIIFFCVSYLLTLKLLVEPRYQYLTEEGVTARIEEMQQEIADLNHQIQQLNEQLEAAQKEAESADSEDK
ncbi:MAG: hypothetical protein ACOX7F_04420 [Eubacteriales bacterium]|jgi:peptidoglycan hydrolase CwlO-like protein